MLTQRLPMLAGALVLLGLGIAHPATAQSYTFTSFDPVGSQDTIPLGLNNTGLGAGEFSDAPRWFP